MDVRMYISFLFKGIKIGIMDPESGLRTSSQPSDEVSHLCLFFSFLLSFITQLTLLLSSLIFNLSFKHMKISLSKSLCVWGGVLRNKDENIIEIKIGLVIDLVRFRLDKVRLVFIFIYVLVYINLLLEAL